MKLKKISLFITGLLMGVTLTTFAQSNDFYPLDFLDKDQFNEWNKEAIQRMSEKGVMRGYENGNFGPNDYVTRSQLAVILDRFEKNMLENEEVVYQEPETEAMAVSIHDDAVKGKTDAPITIIEFVDYECPYCGSFFKETYPQIVQNYIDTGKVKYVVRDFPLPFHENAATAANAAECVKDQGGDEMYYQFHDLLFTNQNILSVENYKTWAKGFDINQEKFASCVDENKFKAEVEADMKMGESYGVQGTPAFFINGKSLMGAQPYYEFVKMIEDELKLQSY